MEWSKVLVGALYRQFLLRDVFGKIVPGSLVVAYLSRTVMDRAPWADPSTVFTILFIGFAWIVGMGIQLASQRVRISADYPRSFEDLRRRFDFTVNFHRLAPEDDYEATNVERLVVIKEATGNTAGALAFLA